MGEKEPCPICEDEFTSKVEMLYHFTQDHNQSEQSTGLSKAKEANSFSPEEYSFDLSPEAEKSVCRICGSEHQTHLSMVNHISGSHSIEQKKSALIGEITRVYEYLGHVPTPDDLLQLNTFSHSMYNGAFDSWTKAVKKAGYTPHRYKASISRSELLEILQNFIEDNSGMPRAIDFDEYAPFSVGVMNREFGSWGNALKSVGENDYTKSPQAGELISDIQNVAEMLGKSPTSAQYRKHGQYTTSNVAKVFGSWNDGLRKCDLEIHGEYVGPIKSDELISDIQRVAEIVGKSPTLEQYSEYGKYGSTTIDRKLGSWNGGLRKSGLEPNMIHDGDRDGTIYYGENWMKQRQRALIRDNNQCRVTGKHSSEIDYCSVHVHHIAPARSFGAHDSTIETDHSKMNSLENLICLSPTCHKKLERKFQDADPDSFAIRGKEYLRISS